MLPLLPYPTGVGADAAPSESFEASTLSEELLTLLFDLNDKMLRRRPPGGIAG